MTKTSLFFILSGAIGVGVGLFAPIFDIVVQLLLNGVVLLLLS